MPHLAKQVQRPHAGYRIGANAHRNAGVAEQLDRRESVAMAQIRFRTQRDRAFALGQQLRVFRPRLDSVYGQEARPEHTQLIQEGNGRARGLYRWDVPLGPGLGERPLSASNQRDFGMRLCDVHRDRQVVCISKLDRLAI